jgi:hypothetical protein
MISDFETACLCQNLNLGMVKNNLDALAPCASKSSESFFVRINFSEKEFNLIAN